ncbi:MAG: tetratricopeptide repeat protein [Niastella sp.]|uniref:tetratricopeptide repeat protein n=1 Tax=Niastella sp. TaxID=1869183 RepID=UPI003899B66A
MGLFEFLKNKKNQSENSPIDNQSQVDDQLQLDIDRFETELLATIPRYICTPGAEVNIKARHQETNEVMPFAIGFPEQFKPWRTVKSLADRRGIVYSLLDTQFGNQLELWQVIERFNDDRYAERALQIANKHKQERDEQNPNYWNALARTNFILSNYNEAEQNCLKAIQLDNNSIRTKRIYADVLHTTGKQDKSHEIYNEILSIKLPKDKQMNLPIQDLLGFDGDILNSPVYAIAWLKADKNVNTETWEWANEEFYYSPHFRSQYAFHLLQTNEHMKGFVKLLNLSKEMPWFKDAVLNSYSLIDQLNLTEQAQDEKIRLKQIMEKNNWSPS